MQGRELEPASGGSRGPSNELEITDAAVRALRLGGAGAVQGGGRHQRSWRGARPPAQWSATCPADRLAL